MQLVLAVCLCLLAGTAHSMCSPSLCSDCESSGECSTNSCTWMTTGNLGPRCESSPGQPADQSVSVEGKCSGNTDSNQNVNCASGDGTNVGNTHNKGSSVDGTTPAQCCEAPPTGGSSSSIEETSKLKTDLTNNKEVQSSYI